MAEREVGTGGEIENVIDWFLSRDGRWAASTVRQYRAALYCALASMGLQPSERGRLERLVAKGPAPRVGGPKKTSARKRKSLRPDEGVKLVKYLSDTKCPDDALLSYYISIGLALFLRPSEYLNAHVRGRLLYVKNAKATNGRANGEYRKLDLAKLGKDRLVTLARFLQSWRKAAESAGGWPVLHGRLSARLARVCRKLKIRRVSLYTIRHVGMATAKLHLEPHEVAAAAGHASVVTAITHYAKRRTGWRQLKCVCRPTLDSVAGVRGVTKFFRPSGVVWGAPIP